jgi:hypothetical protein
VSAGPDPNANVNLIEETRKQINRLFEEVARLAEADLPPTEFYGEFLKRVLTALAAPAGAVWTRTAQGNLQLAFQINMREVGLDASEEGRESHDELLRQAVMQPQPRYLPPRSSAGAGAAGSPGAGNPTDYLLLLTPIVVDNQVAGLLEVWQAPDRHPNAIRGFLEFMMRMAELATRYTRNHMLRQMVGQQQLWVQLETFARQIHGSLNPIECSYLIANEGRRLIECDRVSIGVRYGRRVTVDAISGADVVEKRSNLVQLMRTLFDKVLKWGEKLVFTGTKDDTLPPDVYKALDAYLAESNSKLLVVLPLKDERESESKKPPRSALMMECFEPSAAPEQLFARLEVIGRHATPALYNAVEHRRIPFRFVWMPIAKVQEGLGGKAKAITLLISTAVVALVLAMIFIPYPLKMDATGNLLPETRRVIYSPVEGQVREVAVPEDKKVRGNQNLLLMYDATLGMRFTQLQKEITASATNILSLRKQLNNPPANLPLAERARMDGELRKEEANVRWKEAERTALLGKLHLEANRGPGFFWITSPKFPEDLPNRDKTQWTVLNTDYKETLPDRVVKPSDPLLRLGYNEGNWEIEMKIPQKHVGQILAAFEKNGNEDLDVDILVRSAPTSIFKGKLARAKLAGGAAPNKDDNNESEPVVLAYVRLVGKELPGGGKDIPDAYSLPVNAPRLLVAGTEVHAKVKCGNHAMGYSLLYGVWEFFYEKVVFFF